MTSRCTDLYVGVRKVVRALVADVDIAVLLHVDAMKASQIHLRVKHDGERGRMNT